MKLKSFKRIIVLIIILSAAFSFAKGEKPNQTPRINIFFSEKDFNTFFPQRDKFYSYAAFSKAIAEMANIKLKIEKRGDWIYKITRTDKTKGEIKVVRQDPAWNEEWAKAKPYTISEIDYSDFCADKNLNIAKKELAALFAHIAHETRNGMNNQFNDGLMLKCELDTNSAYIISNLTYPAVEGKKYYGRGPLQLSYNGNYGFASECIFGDKIILLNQPSLIAENAIVAFKSAIYFWMTPQSLKPSAHQVITNQWKPSEEAIKNGYKNGFGLTINIVNGALECNQGEKLPAMLDRIGFYQHFLKLLKVADEDCRCSCGTMIPFQRK